MALQFQRAILAKDVKETYGVATKVGEISSFPLYLEKYNYRKFLNKIDTYSKIMDDVKVYKEMRGSYIDILDKVNKEYMRSYGDYLDHHMSVTEAETGAQRDADTMHDKLMKYFFQEYPPGLLEMKMADKGKVGPIQLNLSSAGRASMGRKRRRTGKAKRRRTKTKK
jgi:hypothetical protein